MFRGKAAGKFANSWSKELQAKIKRPGKAWTTPVDLNDSDLTNFVWEGLPSGSIAALKVKRAGTYKVKLRVAITTEVPDEFARLRPSVDYLVRDST